VEERDQGHDALVMEKEGLQPLTVSMLAASGPLPLSWSTGSIQPCGTHPVQNMKHCLVVGWQARRTSCIWGPSQHAGLPSVGLEGQHAVPAARSTWQWSMVHCGGGSSEVQPATAATKDSIAMVLAVI